jgi:hypothetical protein
MFREMIELSQNLFGQFGSQTVNLLAQTGRVSRAFITPRQFFEPNQIF